MSERTTVEDERWDDEPPTQEITDPDPTIEMPTVEMDPTEGQDTNLLGEPTDAFPAKKGVSTVYAVFELEIEDYPTDDIEEQTREVWIERGRASAAGGRAAILEVVGDAAGDFMAVPESSARRHKRRERTVYAWEDSE